ncbi:MAG: hypothetical protein ACTHKY_18990 [Ginsengibacter sp.]
MKKTFIILIVAIPLLSFTLLPVVFIRDDVKKIDALLVLPPVTQIGIISKGSKAQNYDASSDKTFEITSDYLQKCFPNSVKTKYFSADSLSHAKLDNFILTITSRINFEKQARKYHLPDSIVTLFDTAKIHFVFCISNIGFNRTRDNFINTYQRREMINFFIIPMYKPHESFSSVTCMILDLRQKNILYFERDVLENRDPTDINIIKQQVGRIINHCFI